MSHIDYTRYTMIVDLSVFLPGDDMTSVEMPIVRLDAHDREVAFCDFCPGTWAYAEYEVDAEAVLGEAGHNTLYCQSHMDSDKMAADEAEEKGDVKFPFHFRSMDDPNYTPLGADI
jgi:hypothetical protein